MDTRCAEVAESTAAQDDVWDELFDHDSSRVYYHNRVTGEVAWYKPGWTRVLDPDTGTEYFYNAAEDRSVFTLPPGETAHDASSGAHASVASASPASEGGGVDVPKTGSSAVVADSRGDGTAAGGRPVLEHQTSPHPVAYVETTGVATSTQSAPAGGAKEAVEVGHQSPAVAATTASTVGEAGDSHDPPASGLSSLDQVHVVCKALVGRCESLEQSLEAVKQDNAVLRKVMSQMQAVQEAMRRRLATLEQNTSVAAPSRGAEVEVPSKAGGGAPLDGVEPQPAQAATRELPEPHGNTPSTAAEEAVGCSLASATGEAVATCRTVPSVRFGNMSRESSPASSVVPRTLDDASEDTVALLRKALTLFTCSDFLPDQTSMVSTQRHETKAALGWRSGGMVHIGTEQQGLCGSVLAGAHRVHVRSR